jgi:cytochrome P450
MSAPTTDGGQSSTATTAPNRYYDHFAIPTPEERYAEWAERREQCPVSYSDEHGGFYFLTKYEDVYKGMQDTRLFASGEGVGIPPQPMKLYPEDMDPPLHQRYRHLINAPLSPPSVAAYEPWVREYVRELLGAIGDRREFDVIEALARPLPQMVTMRLLGLPMSDLDIVARTTTTLATAARGNPVADAAGAELFGYLVPKLQEMRQEPPNEGMISRLIHAELDGAPVSDEILLSIVSLVLFGGLHTTTGAIGTALVYLAEHPEDRHALRAELPPTAVEEVVRYSTVSQHLGRTATEDTEVRGCPIPAGSRIMMGIGSANHDPAKFDRPDEMVFDRKPNLHMGFGMGPHRCAGSHLAKLQIRVALEEFLQRYPDFELVDRSLLRWAGGEVHGMETAPLRVLGADA